MAKKLNWTAHSKFAQGIAEGMSATRAYMEARPGANLAQSYAAKEACGLLKQGKIIGMVEHYRKALVERATEEFILTRNEIRRALTLVVTTPATKLQEPDNEWLVQELSVTEGPNGTTTKVKGMSKLGALQELAKLDGHYEAEKAPLPPKSLTFGIEDAHEAFSHDPMYLEFLKEAAVFEAAKRAKVIEIQEAALPPARRTQADLDAALDADEEFQQLIRS